MARYTNQELKIKTFSLGLIFFIINIMAIFHYQSIWKAFNSRIMRITFFIIVWIDFQEHQHCVESDQIRIFFWLVKIRTKKLTIWAPFMQCEIPSKTNKNIEMQNFEIPSKSARTKIKISDAIYNIFSVELSFCDKISVLLWKNL